jgi:trans-2,3-dihydro-3-hydroxyanthranilate isomerase
MKSYPFLTLDVFTNRRFGGNPLAVFYDAVGLSATEMQSLAKEMNLSETTFVFPPEESSHAARVRIFNRTREMPFAGHPTVGTGFVLADHGHARNGSLHLEVGAGIVDVSLRRDRSGIATGATIVAPQPLMLGPNVSPAAIAECVALQASDVLETAHSPVLASMGYGFVIAQVSQMALQHAEPVVDCFRKVVEAHQFLEGTLGLYLYARDQNRIRARMFAPLAGIVEDPATGSANVALGGLLLSLSEAHKAVYEVVQGVEMGRPSLLEVTAWRKGEDIHATVGGDCVRVFSGEISI